MTTAANQQQEASGSTSALGARSEAAALTTFNHQNFWPRDWEDGLRYANLLARAPSMLPKHIREAKDPSAEVFATIMFGFEVGLAPMQSLRAIYIVHGRAGMYAADQIALVQKHPDCEYLEVASDSKGNPLSSATSCTWVTKRRNRKEQRLTFTMAEAEVEGLVSGNAKYKSTPAVMLRWRCATRLLAYTWGDVLRGLEDKEVVETEEKDGGWASRVTPPPTSKAPPPTEPAHDPVTGEVKEQEPTVFERLARRLENATTTDELQACVKEIQEAKAHGAVSEEESMRLLAIYKAKKDAFKAANGGGGK